jgi:hypothetical protein
MMKLKKTGCIFCASIVLLPIIIFIGYMVHFSILLKTNKPIDTWSFSIESKSEKLSFLAKHMNLPSEVLDAEYHVCWSYGLGLGPSFGDKRAVLKIKPEDLPLWIDGFVEIPSSEVDLLWWDTLITEKFSWYEDGATFYKHPENPYGSYIVVKSDHSVILKAYAWDSYLLKKSSE